MRASASAYSRSASSSSRRMRLHWRRVEHPYGTGLGRATAVPKVRASRLAGPPAPLPPPIPARPRPRQGSLLQELGAGVRLHKAQQRLLLRRGWDDRGGCTCTQAPLLCPRPHRPDDHPPDATPAGAGGGPAAQQPSRTARQARHSAPRAHTHLQAREALAACQQVQPVVHHQQQVGVVLRWVPEGRGEGRLIGWVAGSSRGGCRRPAAGGRGTAGEKWRRSEAGERRLDWLRRDAAVPGQQQAGEMPSAPLN